jgi:hypothetical protein
MWKKELKNRFSHISIERLHFQPISISLPFKRSMSNVRSCLKEYLLNKYPPLHEMHAFSTSNNKSIDRPSIFLIQPPLSYDIEEFIGNNDTEDSLACKGEYSSCARRNP